MTLGEKLVALRKKADMSQEKLAEIMGVSRQTIYQWECDNVAPTRDKLEKLTSLFQVSYDYLLNEAIGLNGEKISIPEQSPTEKPFVRFSGRMAVYAGEGSSGHVGGAIAAGLGGAFLAVLGLVFCFVRAFLAAGITCLVIGVVLLTFALIFYLRGKEGEDHSEDPEAKASQAKLHSLKGDHMRLYPLEPLYSFVAFDDEKRVFSVYQYGRELLAVGYDLIAGAAFYDGPKWVYGGFGVMVGLPGVKGVGVGSFSPSRSVSLLPGLIIKIKDVEHSEYLLQISVLRDPSGNYRSGEIEQKTDYDCYHRFLGTILGQLSALSSLPQSR